MTRWLVTAAGTILALGLAGIGCEEPMVGAPCTPETDKGEFNETAKGTTYSIETRSVQCETRLCLTKTQVVKAPDAVYQDGGVEVSDNDMTKAELLEKYEGTQLKFSFCSCRCKDLAGHTYQTDPDKYDDLCECPPNTDCVKVLGAIEEAPDQVSGSYCVPKCIAHLCEDGYVCTPSNDSEEPWKWSCQPE